MDIKLNEIVENLEKLAMEDGKITDEENQFLATLKQNVKEFQASVKKAMSNDEISENEFHDLLILRDKLLSDAYDFSGQSEDLKKLVNELYMEINDFHIPGNPDDDLDDEEIE